MKKVLLIDQSKPFRNFVTQKLERFDIQVIQAINGLDAISKIRSEHPDLIIMDFYLSRLSADEVLKAKMDDPNTAQTPVIMVSAKIARDDVVKVGSYGVKKFFFKPIKLDEFITAVGGLLKLSIMVDDTPSVIEAHVNEGVLFLEVALGLNVDKIDLMQFKIGELIELYRLTSPRVLIMLSGVDITSADSIKLRTLIETVMEAAGAKPRNMVMLTQAPFVVKMLREKPDFQEIKTAGNLAEAMPLLQSKQTDGESFLQKSRGVKGDGSINMRFSTEKAGQTINEDILKDASIAVVDDDPVIQELTKTTFEEVGSRVNVFANGRQFIEHSTVTDFDLVFLDLMMPEMDGFRVLKNLHSRFQASELPPIIVFSAVSRKDAVVTALQNGVKSYLIKPLKPQQLRAKAVEVLHIDFS
ncbi:response regulator [Spirochaeta africana]|uniref:Response regulator with CheY-like receiver domain and winged-helix DNA-binding domain n=1 Tax=Spirochaeta africana (strain ATCC 700263 / DSM 8902 / Z-7692) TaxID=889378 RepID=H9UJU2_SPIAZ|nr:response regulator [Spirochaeta africana]AFG37785.1 response regulator with CheY-like receiver domain and winged-helix DNA-binding domain [Spirochaeta africana DSM 8902]